MIHINNFPCLLKNIWLIPTLKPLSTTQNVDSKQTTTNQRKWFSFSCIITLYSHKAFGLVSRWAVGMGKNKSIYESIAKARNNVLFVEANEWSGPTEGATVCSPIVDSDQLRSVPFQPCSFKKQWRTPTIKLHTHTQKNLNMYSKNIAVSCCEVQGQGRDSNEQCFQERFLLVFFLSQICVGGVQLHRPLAVRNRTTETPRGNPENTPGLQQRGGKLKEREKEKKRVDPESRNVRKPMNSNNGVLRQAQLVEQGINSRVQG